MSDNFGGGDGPRGFNDPDPVAIARAKQDEADRALGATVRAEIKELRENEHRNVTESLTLVILLDLEKKAGLMK